MLNISLKFLLFLLDDNELFYFLIKTQLNSAKFQIDFYVFKKKWLNKNIINSRLHKVLLKRTILKTKAKINEKYTNFLLY